MVKTKIKTVDNDDIYGQYASDYAIQGFDPDHIEDHTGTLDARGDGSATFHHGGVLFDHTDNDKLPDEVTGAVAVRETEEKHYRDMALRIGELPVSRMIGTDAAEMWLRQHDPQYNEKEWH